MSSSNVHADSNLGQQNCDRALVHESVGITDLLGHPYVAHEEEMVSKAQRDIRRRLAETSAISNAGFCAAHF